MINSKLTTAIFVGLVLINITLIYTVFRLRKEQATDKYLLSAYTEKNNQLQRGFTTLKDLNILQFRSDYQDKNVDIKGLQLTTKTLILRVHSNDCNECVKDGLKILEKYAVERTLPVVVCADYPSNKSVSSDLPVLAYPIVLQQQIKTDCDKISDPYIFIYDPIAHTASHFVYLNWQVMDIFERYTMLLNKNSATL